MKWILVIHEINEIHMKSFGLGCNYLKIQGESEAFLLLALTYTGTDCSNEIYI
jgi:hypothetical protein